MKWQPATPLSLALRLFLSLFFVILLGLSLVGLFGLRSANVKISQEYDAQLITATNVLWDLMHEDVKQGDSFELNVTADSPLAKKIHHDALKRYSQWRAFRIWKGADVVINSENTENMPAAPAAAGFSDVLIEGDPWRIFSLHIPEENMVVESFENLRNRELLQQDILTGIAVPALVVLPLLGILMSLGIRWGLERLHRLAGRLESRTPSDMSRLPYGDLPRELKPLASAVNTLLGKLESSLAHEREFIDHAAHELRTPLAALKLQAQLIAASVTAPAQQESIADFLRGVERTTHLVDQLLLLSRVTHQELALQAVDLRICAQEAIGMLAVRAVDKRISLALEADAPTHVSAQPELLRVLITTLLDNAIKYTPPGGEILVTITHSAQQALFTIRDSGEGIPEHERAQVFDRFYRISTTKQSGSGLGLAIAKQICELFAGSISLSSPASGQGLEVKVAFPLIEHNLSFE